MMETFLSDYEYLRHIISSQNPPVLPRPKGLTYPLFPALQTHIFCFVTWRKVASRGRHLGLQQYSERLDSVFQLCRFDESAPVVISEFGCWLIRGKPSAMLCYMLYVISILLQVAPVHC